MLSVVSAAIIVNCQTTECKMGNVNCEWIVRQTELRMPGVETFNSFDMFWTHVSPFNSLIPCFWLNLFLCLHFRRLFLFAWCGECWCVLASGDFRFRSFHFRMDCRFLFLFFFFFFFLVETIRFLWRLYRIKILLANCFCFCVSVNVCAMCVLLIWNHIQHSKWFVVHDGVAGYCIYAIKQNEWILASALALAPHTDIHNIEMTFDKKSFCFNIDDAIPLLFSFCYSLV